MGLISRVSSRTYRSSDLHQNFFLLKNSKTFLFVVSNSMSAAGNDYYAQGESHQEAAKGSQDGQGAAADQAASSQQNGAPDRSIDIQDGEIQTTWHEVHETFDDMNLDSQLLRGIYGYGFEKPSTIQQRAIVPCIKGHDVIAQAQSGTDKTATFAISCLQNIDVELPATQALILGPTRELAQQIQKVVLSLGDYMGASCYACVGGNNMKNEIQRLQADPQQIIVGTPGRVFDMITRKVINPRDIKIFVLDEADEMLSRGFKDQIYDIFRTLPGN